MLGASVRLFTPHGSGIIIFLSATRTAAEAARCVHLWNHVPPPLPPPAQVLSIAGTI